MRAAAHTERHPRFLILSLVSMARCWSVFEQSKPGAWCRKAEHDGEERFIYPRRQHSRTWNQSTMFWKWCNCHYHVQKRCRRSHDAHYGFLWTLNQTFHPLLTLLEMPTGGRWRKSHPQVLDFIWVDHSCAHHPFRSSNCLSKVWLVERTRRSETHGFVSHDFLNSKQGGRTCRKARVFLMFQ